MKITFPNKTAKEIIEACDNKLGDRPFLYSISWYKDEDFYTKEKCRKGEREISDEIEHYGKSWNECSILIKGEMLNFAEYVWVIKCYFEKNGKLPEENDYKWSWTSSRSSRGYLVYVGSCDSDGVGVYYGRPGRSYSNLGVRFSRAIDNAYITPSEPDTIGASIKKVKDAGYMVLKQL